MTPHAVRQDPAFTVMTLDILHNILSRADNPGQLVEYLTGEIRELTGARCVIFIQCLNDLHRVLAVDPSRHLAWAKSPQRESLYDLAHALSVSAVWEPETPSAAAHLLQQDGFGLSMAFPLSIGSVRVGAMLVLGLPDQQHIVSEIKLLTTLSTIVALVLRNSFLFESQEDIIAERTKELRLAAFTLDSMEDSVYWIKPDASFLKVNASVCRMLGYSSAELQHLTITDINPIFPMETWPAHWQMLKQAGSLHFETKLRTKDGRDIPVDVITNHIELAGKEYHCAIVRDISARKQAEKEKAHLEVQLQQAQKMEAIGQLAGGVAHDFNNMLGVILGHTEMAMDQIGMAQPVLADLDEIRKAANRSADITRQLLAFARKQIVSPKVLDLNETVEGMLKMLRRLIGEDINLVWLPGLKLWPVNVDPSQIDQILANLCLNARDAIAGVGKITVETQNKTFDAEYCETHSGFVIGEYVRMSICDNGCGMDKDTLAHIFEPFYTTKEIGKGTGLGLATVYGALKQNNGFINVYSEPGQGTNFTIYLPRHAAKVGDVSSESVKPGVGGHETILLVEDEPAILKMTTTMLQRLGYNVLSAGTPREGLRLATKAANEIHLLFTDIVMPEMNGRDLADNLLPIHPHLKCLFMSGYTSDIIAQQGILEEGVEFIQKPFSKNDLARKVRIVLDKS